MCKGRMARSCLERGGAFILESRAKDARIHHAIDGLEGGWGAENNHRGVEEREMPEGGRREEGEREDGRREKEK
jgi:hypothetical protein